jgi:hypothetical protein
MSDGKSPATETGQVLPFRQRRSDELLGPDDLAKYEQDEEPDDYRHRMLMNLAGFVVVALLMGAGLWLAISIADMRKNQDCVLSGRRGCTPVEVSHERW